MIDWSKRFSDDEFIDLQGLPYYNLSFNNGTKKEIYGLVCDIPDEPDDEDCVNFGLTEWDQIFRKTYIPPQVINPEKEWGRQRWTERDLESFIDAEYNRRKNGIWMWIKGVKTYIPGQLYFKLNYWKSMTGEEFLYRTHETEFFTFAMHVQRSPVDIGIADFKCRQLGDTENVLCMMYERGSRKRGSLNTLQSCINQDHIERTYHRLVFGHRNMIWYMKPMNTGTEASMSGLKLDYPSKHMTHAEAMKQASKGNMVNKSSAENYEYPPIGSSFEYGPSKVKHFDGATGLLNAYDDEFGKCFGPNTKLLMYDGSYKLAKNIKVNDLLMGDDGLPKKVLNTHSGRSEMYKIIPKSNGWDSWTCNKNHVLVLKWCRGAKYDRWEKGEIVHVSVDEFMNFSNNLKRHFCLYREGVHYDRKDVYIDPYFLGIWLGDGHKSQMAITSIDNEVIEYVKHIANKNNLLVRKDDDKTLRISSGRTAKNSNCIINEFNKYSLINNKHIPLDYLFNDRETRLNLLAGIIDSDGYLMSNKMSYEICQKNKKLAFQINKLCLELGYKSTIKLKKTSYKKRDGSYFKGTAYVICVFGKNTYEIPCKIARKKAVRRKMSINQRDSKKTCFSIKEVGIGEFYGFETDGNHKFLLRDCQVVHNSHEMDPVEWISTMVQAAFNHIKGVKRAVLWMTSTVEDIDEKSLDYAMQIWREADPSKRMGKTGSTMNRIVRIFRGVTERGYENIVGDRWGDIDKEAVIEAVTEKYNAYLEAGNTRGAMSFIRKEPRTIDDVFMSVRNQSSFNTRDLAKREFYLNEVASPKPYVRGNLKWKDGIKDSEVMWEPNENGRWLISKHPKDFGAISNAKSQRTFSRAPGNPHLFAMGVDPVDQSKTLEDESKRSKIGICVMRRLDETVDSDRALWHQKEDEINGISVGDPIMQGEMHQTNRVCCTYLNRSPDVFDNFEDIILTAAYYGTDFLPENNKAGALKTYLRQRQYDLYLSDKPSLSQNYKGQFEKDGVTGSEKTFNECFSFIETYTYKWVNSIDHPDLSSQLMTMNWANRGEKDLGVAFGWCLYHSHQISRTPSKNRSKGNKRRHFYENAV